MSKTPRSRYASTLHRDGTATVWDVYDLQWHRVRRLGDAQSASMESADRARVQRHLSQVRG